MSPEVLAALAASGGGAAGPQGDSTDVFSTYVTSGTGSTVNIISGINMSAGGMHSCKSRTTTTSWKRTDTVRGVTKALSSNLTSAEVTEAGGVTAFNSDGITLGSDADYNASGQDFVHYFFKESPKFFDQTLISHTNGAQSNFDATSLGEVGMVEVKQVNGASDWFVWHKDLTAGNNLRLNTTAAQSLTNAYVSVSGTTVSISSSAPSGDYIVYMYAHDPDADNGIIQCGSFTGNISVVLGFEPQDIEYKRIDSTGNWVHVDSIRGIVSGGNEQELYSNLSSAETTSSNDFITLTSTGFDTTNITGTYIFRAIRRPNRVPTSGTEVFAVDNGDGFSDNPGYTSGFPVDLVIAKNVSALTNNELSARLIQAKKLITNGTNAESTDTFYQFDYMNGVGSQARTTDVYSYMLKRAPGFMDVAVYKGDGIAGRAVNHNLNAVPELIIVKSTNSPVNWAVYYGDETSYMRFNSNIAGTTASYWNNTLPSESIFTVDNNTLVNANNYDYIAILFATLPGISKVFSYTGNGTSQTIPCGFTSGARFVLIKSTSTTGDWWLYDSLRGIVAGNDPALRLNSTAAQVSVDAIDPVSSGFIVNEEATCSINTNGVNYVGLTIS